MYEDQIYVPMAQIIGGKRYSTERATLIAHDAH